MTQGNRHKGTDTKGPSLYDTLENWQLLLHSNKEKENDVNCGGADTRGQTQKDRPCMTQGNRHKGTDTKGPSLYDK